MTKEAQHPRGALVLSFDLELGWGSVENQMWRQLEREQVFERTRPAMESLLQTMRSLDVPALWAVVGALCQKYGAYNLEYVPTEVRQGIEDMLQSAQPTTVDGRDLVEAIVSEPIGHLLGCHSYAHVRYGHRVADNHFVAADLSMFARYRPLTGNWAPVIIFPCNEEAHLDEIYQAGYRCCRASAHPPVKSGGVKRWFDRTRRMFTCPPLSTSRDIGPGFQRWTDSLLFNTGRRAALVPWVLRRARRGLRRAVKEGGTLHVWTHPFNLAETPELLQSLQTLLYDAARLRDAGRLSILPFGYDVVTNRVS